jgi:hypothetical protein
MSATALDRAVSATSRLAANVEKSDYLHPRLLPLSYRCAGLLTIRQKSGNDVKRANYVGTYSQGRKAGGPAGPASNQNRVAHSKALGTRLDRPRGCHAANRDNEFSPSDADCHVTSRGGHTHAMEGRYYALVARFCCYLPGQRHRIGLYRAHDK